jgi:hypothetical protein
MAKAGITDLRDQFDVTNNAGSGGGDGFNPYATTNNKPATLDINVTGGFLQATGSLSANKFSDIQHGAGRIFFPSASVEAAIDRTEYPAPRYRIPPKQSRRFVILNERQIALQRPLELYDFEGDRFVYPELDSSLLQFSMSFENSVVTPATSSFFLGSYADITFGNLRTYSGDIHRMKVYAKYQNDQSDQETRIGDFIVRDKNELIDRNSVSGQAPIGIFYSQSVVDNNWVSSSNTSGPIQKNDSEIMSAVLLSGSNYNDGEFFDFKTSQYVPLVKAQDYIVNFASYFIKKPKQQPDGSVVDRAQIEVLLSGSVESTNQDLLSLGTISGLGDDSSETLEGKISGSIPNLFNYFTTHASIGAEPSASLVFRVHAGQFHIGRVQLRPLTFSNFHPDSYRVKLPMPKKVPRNQQYDFRVEFYDFNNNKAQVTTESTASIFFTGTNDVIDGLDNHLEGSMLWGNAMEIYGVSGNSAYMRSVGYQGFDKTRAGTGERNGGFMIFSGSIGTRITASEAYEGVGIEIVDASAGSGNPGQHKYLQFLSNYQNTGNARFRVQTDEFYFGQDRTVDGAQFISGSEGKIEISSSNFHLDNDGSIIMQGTITAEAGGTIGGFTIGSDNLTATDFVLNTTNKSLSLGSGNTIFIADADDGIQLGHATFASAPFSVTPAGVLKAESGTIGGFTLSSNELTATNFELNPSGKRITLGTGNSIFIADGDEGIQLGNATFASAPFSVTTAGVLKAESGTIGGWTLSSTTLTGGTITLDSSGIIEAGGLTGISDTTNTGFYVDNSGQILIRQSATDFLKFSGGSLEMKARSFVLDANSGDLKLDSVNKRISINDSTFGNAGVQLEHDTGTGKFYAGDGSSKFIQFDGSDVNIQSDDFLLSTNTLIIDSGTSNGVIKLGTNATSITETLNTGVYIDGNGKFRIGTATSGTDYLHFDGSSIDIKTQAFELDTTNLDISSTNERIDLGNGKIILQGAATSTITIGASNSIVLSDNGTDRFIKFGDKTDFAQTGTEGLIMGTNNGNAEFDMTIGTGNDKFFRANSSGIDIATPNFKLDTTNLDIDSSISRIVVSDASNERVRIGEISDAASDLYGMKIYDGSGTTDSNTLVKLGEEGNEIAGWTITNDRLTGGNMIIRQDGTIESSQFSSGTPGSGFRLTADDGGFLEVENARIRGTLKTTVFEKETVNAVGGQLYIANSTTLTSSAYFPSLNQNGIHTETQRTMSVENASGFVSGEILAIKKVNPTGFTTEYVYVESASRSDQSSDTNFTGEIYVIRGYSGSAAQGRDTGSLGDSPNAPQHYSGSQVIVSTGRYISGAAPNTIGTGYIRMNANPADPYSPYIDIVERTGSQIYDVELKARLGDLSGLSSGLLYGETNPGFGLFTENVFLQGAITAQTGSFTGIVHIGTSAAEEMRLGIDVNSTNDGLHINNNNYWYTTGAFKVGSSNYYLQNDASGNITIQPKTFELDIAPTNGRSLHDLEISSTETSMSFSDRELVLKAGTYNSTNAGFITIGDNSSIEMTGSNALAAIRSVKKSFSDNTAGFWLANNNGTQEFYIGTATEHLKFDGTNISLEGSNIALTADNVDVTTGTFEVDADDFQLSSTNKSASLGYDTNADSGITIKGGDPSYIYFGSKTTPPLKLVSDDQVGVNEHYLSTNNKDFGDTTAGIIIGSDATTQKLELYKDSNEYLTYSSTDGFDLQTTKIQLSTGQGLTISGRDGSTPANNKILLGSATTVDAGEGFYVDGAGNFRIGDATSGGTDYMKFTPSGDLVIKSTDVDITSTNFTLDASGIDIESSDATITLGEGNLLLDGGNSIIKIGATTSKQVLIEGSSTVGKIYTGKTDVSQTTAGFWIANNDGDPEFHVGDAAEFIKFDGGALSIKSSDIDITSTAFSLDATTLTIDSSGDGGAGSITVGSNVTLNGSSNSTISGFTLGSSQLYTGTKSTFASTAAGVYIGTDGIALGTSSPFKVTSAGALTATSATITGNVTATTLTATTAGSIAGWTIGSNSLTGGNVTLKSAGLMGISGSTTVGGSPVTTNILMDTDASKGSEIALQREDFGGDLTNFVELHTSQSYFENNIGSYVSGSTRDNKDFTRDANDSETVLMSGTGAGAWGSSVYLRSDGSDLDDILIENTISATNQLLDTGETNLITEIELQNLTEQAGAGTGKSLFRWKGEVFQNDTNATAGAELVGSFRISSVLSLSAAASPLNISSKFLLTKRYFYVKITGTDYDILTGSGVESWTLDSSGTAPQIRGTKYLPRVITSGIGQQFFAGPNQEAKFGAKNEVIGNFKVKETLAGTAGDIVAEGKMSVGTFDIDDTFDLFVDGAIGATGNIVGFYSSDKRLKENIVEIKDGLSLINQLRPVKFDWKQDSPFGHLKPTEYGLIAQEVQEVIPEIVGHMKDDYKGINYEKIVPLLISSIQQLTKRVEELEQDK